MNNASALSLWEHDGKRGPVKSNIKRIDDRTRSLCEEQDCLDCSRTGVVLGLSGGGYSGGWATERGSRGPQCGHTALGHARQCDL